MLATDHNGLVGILRYELARRYGPDHALRYTVTVPPNILSLRINVIEPAILNGLTFNFDESRIIPEEVDRVLRRTLDVRQATHQMMATGMAQWRTVVDNPLMHTRLTNVTVPDPVPDPPDPWADTVFNLPPGRVNLEVLNRAWEAIAQPVPVVPVTTTVNPFTRWELNFVNNQGAAMPTAVRATRTIEQEDRYQALDHLSGNRALNETESLEYNTLAELRPYIAPVDARVRIKVRVWRDTHTYSSRWNIVVKVLKPGQAWTACELPNIAAIKPFIPDSERPKLGRERNNSYRALVGGLDNGISPQVIVDALKAWAMASASQASSAEGDSTLDEEGLSLLRANPATLEVGGKVYRLVPTGEINVQPLIRRVKVKALAQATLESQGIRTRAQADARVVVNEAEQRAARIREEIEVARRGANAQAPAWVRASGRAHYWDGSYWNVELRVGCKVREIRWTVNHWGAGGTVLYWNPIRIPGKRDEYYNSRKMPAWVRLGAEGAITLRSVFMKDFTVTHISSYCCMGLQGVPTRIADLNNLNALEVVLTRGMQVVNLNSPLSNSPGHYWPDFKEQLPEIVLQKLQELVSFTSASPEEHLRHYPNVTWDRSEAITVESDSTFTVDDPRLARVGTVANTHMNVAIENELAIAMPPIPDRGR